MSDEEKKAVEIVKEIKDIRGMRQDVEGENEDLWALDIVIELIEKQQKEIEELKKYEEGYKLLSYSLDNYVSKDKIKAKIEEANKIIDEDKDFINKFQNSVDANAINWYYQKVDLNVRIRNILESLLEKE